MFVAIGLEAGAAVGQLPAAGYDDHPDKVQGDLIYIVDNTIKSFIPLSNDLYQNLSKYIK